MIATDLLLWIALAVAGLVLAGLGSALETGFYCLNPVRLDVLEHTGNRSARLLARHLAAPSALIATLLITHNFGVKIATHSAAILLSKTNLTVWEVVALDALIMMPILFVVAETVPKNLFALHADRLMYPLAKLTTTLVALCWVTGLTPFLTWVSRRFMRLLGVEGTTEALHPRHRVQALVKEGLGHGVLDDAQLALTERIMSLGDQTVADHMQPWGNVITVKTDADAERVHTLAHTTTHARFPMIDAAGEVTGLLNLKDVLVHPRRDCPPIATFSQSIQHIDAATTLRHGLLRLRETSAFLAVVTHHGRPVGIVTMKDLIGPITGELEAW